MSFKEWKSLEICGIAVAMIVRSFVKLERRSRRGKGTCQCDEEDCQEVGEHDQGNFGSTRILDFIVFGFGRCIMICWYISVFADFGMT